jgi:PAS domain S-box-containing protein
MDTMTSTGFPLATTLISTTREGIMVIGADDRVNFVSDRMAEMLGYSPSEMVGKAAVDFVHDAAAEQRLEVLRQGHGRLSQCRIRRKDGSELWGLVSLAPIRDEQNDFHGVLGMFTDVTAQRTMEREKSLILDAMTDHLTYLDPQLRIRHLNRVAANSARAITEEPLGRYCYELRHGRSFPCPACPTVKTLETGAPAEAEQETPDGRCWHVRTYPVFGEQGEVAGVAEFALDVTEARRAAEALRDRDEIIRAVLEASNNPVIVIRAVRDEAERICDFEGVLANPAAEALMCRCVGMRLSTVHTAISTPDLVPAYSRVVTSGQPVTTEMSFEGPGETRWFMVRAVKVGDGAAVTFTDITERKNAELEASTVAEQLRQAQITEAVNRFGAGLAHDLNGLLHCVTGYTELARRHFQQSHPARDDLRQAATAARAARTLVRRLLTMRASTAFQPAPIHMNRVIEEYADVLRCLVGERVTLRLDLRAELDRVQGVASELEQALLNLCLNARDAMPTGGRITVATEDVPGGSAATVTDGAKACFVRLSVSDTGIGMSEEVLDHIFEPLFTTKSPERGTGLGLPTVRTIVERHGGTMEVESTKGLGTTVRLLFPWWKA